MPTKHPRIAVTKDDELASALVRVERLFEGVAAATVVHQLALKGAEAFEREQEERDAAIERLVAFSTAPDELIDLEVLADIDSLAWE